MPTPPEAKASTAAPTPTNHQQADLATLRRELQEALRRLGSELRGVLPHVGQDAVGLALLPLRVMFGLPLVVGTLWGLAKTLLLL